MSGCKLHLISHLYKVELGLKSLLNIFIIWTNIIALISYSLSKFIYIFFHFHSNMCRFVLLKATQMRKTLLVLPLAVNTLHVGVKRTKFLSTTRFVVLNCVFFIVHLPFTRNWGFNGALQEISKPLTWHRFGSPDMDDTEDEAGSYFISAVCWKSDRPTILTANSQGTIKVLVLAAWSWAKWIECGIGIIFSHAMIVSFVNCT